MTQLISNYKQLIFILLVTSILGCSTNSENQILIEELERDMPMLMEKAMIPGASISVIKNGKIIWSKGFGVKNSETKELVSENTVFPAASLTKALFSYLVMTVVDKGDLELDKPLVEYIPISKIENMLTHPVNTKGFQVEWLNEVTARMVLSHTSGFSHGFMGVSIPYPLRFKPGTQYQYSGDGYGYLSMVIEHIRNESLETLMLNEVIKPLGMNNSSMVWQDRFETKIAYGHDMYQTLQNELSKSYTANPSAGLYTTAEDYAKFVLNIIKGKDINENIILDFLRPQIGIGKGVSWGSGFGIDSTKLGDLFWHTGDLGPYRHFFIGSRNNESGIVFMTNSHNGLRIVNELVKGTIGIEECLGIKSQGYEDYNTPDFKINYTINIAGMEHAINVINGLARSNPEEGENLIRGIGINLMNCKKYVEAIGLLQEGTKLYPRSARIYSAIASVSYRKGDYTQAIENFQHVLDIDNDNRTAQRYMKFVELTKILLNDGFDDALKYYKNLLNIDSVNFNELNLSRYGFRLLQAGRIQDAIEIFKVNLHFNKESSDANLCLGDAYATNNENDLALKYIKKALEISPGNGWAKSSLSKLENK